MNWAYPKQKFQDWFTQQWTMLWGRKILPKDHPWLMGPYGELGGIGTQFIEQLATRERLEIHRQQKNQGLIPSMKSIRLTDEDFQHLQREVIDFYENTSEYQLNFKVKWNPIFKIFGKMVNMLFSNRIYQLNIPIQNLNTAEAIQSEIITLKNPMSQEVVYTLWLRTIKSNGKVIYSGIYELCTLPSSQVCVKAVFPLPQGNATVIMQPSVGENGELILNSSGQKFGDAGFYFLVKDTKKIHWAQFIATFKDRLVVGVKDDQLFAQQVLTLWGFRVLSFDYQLNKKIRL